jgi:hypothetical protein
VISPARRNLLIVLSIFWLLISWLVASLRPGADGAVILMETLQIFIPGFFLLALALSIELMRAERHTAVVRKDVFGGLEVFVDQNFLYIPFFFEIVARMPVYPLRIETPVERIDTRTQRLQPIPMARVRCVFQITDFRACLAQSSYAVQRIKEIEARDKLKPTDAGMWPLLLRDVLSRYLDDNLRSTVWTWQRAVENNAGLTMEAFSSHVPRPQVPPQPALKDVMENDPYDLSLNREKLSEVLQNVVAQDADEWGITVMGVVVEQVVVDDKLIDKRVRNKDGEIGEAKHQGQLDYIAIKARGLAEAEVRARTVRRILQELIAAQGLPTITEKTIADIVRSAMYSDGEMIWKGVLEKSATPPGTAKTA